MTSRAQFLNPTYYERTALVSNALWCDKSEHAFSAKDPEKQHFTQTQTVTVNTGNSYGNPVYQDRQEVTQELDICGPCWKAGNDFTQPKPIDELEKEDASYRRGYSAAEDRWFNRDGG